MAREHGPGVDGLALSEHVRRLLASGLLRRKPLNGAALLRVGLVLNSHRVLRSFRAVLLRDVNHESRAESLHGVNWPHLKARWGPVDGGLPGSTSSPPDVSRTTVATPSEAFFMVSAAVPASACHERMAGEKGEY